MNDIFSNQEWRPIETAPKDGTEVLVARGELIWLDYWIRFSPSREEGYWDGLEHDDRPYTHWMPLPEPPINAGAEK